MYHSSFYLNAPVGNNALSYDKRANKKLFVPNLIESTIENIELWEHIVFEDFDFDGKLISGHGLKHFYHIQWMGKDLYLFDNHNHAYYFWHKARNEHIIGNENILYHVDEHSDMRRPKRLQTIQESLDLQKVFEYTNYELNVGNYIVPALENGLIKEVHQIRNEHNLFEYDFSHQHEHDIILNFDLDFFEPELDFIDYDLKKRIILDIAQKAKVITVATSPFFIEQSLAIKVFFDLFWKK